MLLQQSKEIQLKMADISQEVDLTMEEDTFADILQETPPDDVFVAPSIDRPGLLEGHSYTYHSPVPNAIRENMSRECVLGVDEAGRGPVLGESDLL